MAYRAHIIVTDPNTGKPLGSTRLVAELKGLIGTGKVRRGTRHGHVGLWLERDRKIAFESVLAEIVQWFTTTGYEAKIGFTNTPSEYAGIPIVRFWKNRGGRLTYGRV